MLVFNIVDLRSRHIHLFSLHLQHNIEYVVVLTQGLTATDALYQDYSE